MFFFPLLLLTMVWGKRDCLQRGREITSVHCEIPACLFISRKPHTHKLFSPSPFQPHQQLFIGEFQIPKVSSPMGSGTIKANKVGWNSKQKLGWVICQMLSLLWRVSGMEIKLSCSVALMREGSSVHMHTSPHLLPLCWAFGLAFPKHHVLFCVFLEHNFRTRALEGAI